MLKLSKNFTGNGLWKNKAYFFLIDLEKANLHQKAKREQKWGPYFTYSIETLYDNSARQSKEKKRPQSKYPVLH